MADYEAEKSVHKMLSGTKVDRVKLTKSWSRVEVINLGNTSLYVGVNTDLAGQQMVARADNTDRCPPNNTMLIPWPPDGIFWVAGDGNDYSLIGTRFQGV